jgi:hypothetical protein
MVFSHFVVCTLAVKKNRAGFDMSDQTIPLSVTLLGKASTADVPWLLGSRTVPGPQLQLLALTFLL